MKLSVRAVLPAALLFSVSAFAQPQKPAITLDEFMNASEILDAHISPDGTSAVMCSSTPDWQHDRFKEDLWLWTKQSVQAIPLTQSGHDCSPQWSSDGR